MLNSETQLHYSLEVPYEIKCILLMQSKNYTFCCLPKGTINSYPKSFNYNYKECKATNMF